MARTAKKAGWIRDETIYGTDADPDGSSYLWAPTFSIGEIPNGRVQLETNFFTGRDQGTPPIPGPDGGQVEIMTPVIGLPTEAGDSVSASVGVDDWYDDIWESHVSDTPTEREGENVNAGSTASTIVFDAASTDLAAEDLICVYDAAVLPRRGQWARITSGATVTWNTAPNWEATPSAAAIAFAARQYVFTTLTQGGSPRTWAFQDDNVDAGNVTYYTAAGGRIVSRSIAAEAGGRWEDKQTWAFDTIYEDRVNKTLLPVPGIAPAVTPLICTLSPVWFNGTRYSTKRISIDFNIEAQPDMSTGGPNGRQGWDILRCHPTVTIEPLRTDDLRDLKASITTGPLLVQLGAGIPANGVLNTCAFSAASAYVMESEPSDDNGRSRQTVTFKVCDPGSATARFWQFARA